MKPDIGRMVNIGRVGPCDWPGCTRHGDSWLKWGLRAPWLSLCRAHVGAAHRLDDIGRRELYGDIEVLQPKAGA